MPVCGRFELNVTTNTQDELDKIAEAVYNGYAETIIKERVLWPQYGTQAAPVATAALTEPGPALKRTATKVKANAAPPTPVKKERATGVMGRGRMGRT